METRILKNSLAFLGFMITMVCVSSVPYMVKWFMGLYVIYLVAIWLGDDKEDHK